jgi:hypothetical protein
MACHIMGNVERSTKEGDTRNGNYPRRVFLATALMVEVSAADVRIIALEEDTKERLRCTPRLRATRLRYTVMIHTSTMMPKTETTQQQ